MKHLKNSTEQSYVHRASLTYACDVFLTNLHSEIFIVPPEFIMAPPSNCQKCNNETIETAVLEIVRNEAFEE